MSKAKEIIFAIGLAIVFVFFVAFLVESLFPAPKYEDFCKNQIPRIAPIEGNLTEEAEQCLNKGGVWRENSCDLTYRDCMEKFNKSREKYENYLFYFNILVGIAAVLLSLFLSVEAVSLGFMSGGIINLIYGSIRNWDNIPNIGKTVLLGIALAFLVFFGYKKFK